MKTKNRFHLFIVFFALLSITSCSELKQIETKHNQQLKSAIAKALIEKTVITDTLYLITLRELGVCGNDPAHDGITTAKEKKRAREYIRKNPYYIDHNNWKNSYKNNNKTVTTGRIFRTDFSSQKVHFDTDSVITPKAIYEIQFISVKKDTVLAKLLDYSVKREKNHFDLTMVLKDSTWTSL